MFGKNGDKPAERIVNKETIKDTASFAEALLKSKLDGCDGFLLSLHVLKGDKISHTFQYAEFPNGDWGNCMIAMAQEAKKAELSSTQIHKAP